MNNFKVIHEKNVLMEKEAYFPNVHDVGASVYLTEHALHRCCSRRTHRISNRGISIFNAAS